MTTYKIPKQPLCFYFDYVIKNNKCYVIQETKDDRQHQKLVCHTNKTKCDELKDDIDYIYITI